MTFARSSERWTDRGRLNERNKMTSELQNHITQYRESEQALVAHIKSTMGYGTLVHVNCQGRFVGYGKSCGHGARADVVAVLLESLNMWDYPVEFVRPITEEEKAKLPRWLKDIVP